MFNAENLETLVGLFDTGGVSFIAIFAMIVSLIAVIIGPLVSNRIARKQSNTLWNQHVSQLREEWTKDFKNAMSEFLGQVSAFSDVDQNNSADRITTMRITEAKIGIMINPKTKKDDYYYRTVLDARGNDSRDLFEKLSCSSNAKDICPIKALFISVDEYDEKLIAYHSATIAFINRLVATPEQYGAVYDFLCCPLKKLNYKGSEKLPDGKKKPPPVDKNQIRDSLDKNEIAITEAESHLSHCMHTLTRVAGLKPNSQETKNNYQKHCFRECYEGVRNLANIISKNEWERIKSTNQYVD